MKRKIREKIIAPSLLSSDFSCLKEAVEWIERSEAQWVHWDVMDGHFVPNITFGMPVIKSLRKYSAKPFDVHLMIEKPENYIDAFVEAGADLISVHWEACKHLHRCVQMIKWSGAKASVAINPATPVDFLQDILPEIDMVLVMSVNPGFGGQKFIPQSIKKVEKLRQMIDAQHLDVLIEVDGGVNDKTAPLLFNAGADVLVAGSYIFGSEDRDEALNKLL